MESTTNNLHQDAIQLNKLMPHLATQPRVEDSAIHAESHGDTLARVDGVHKVGTHLTRLTKLMEHAGVEARIWDSAVEELIVDQKDIPESYWEQQKQLARDNGLGDVYR